MGSKNGLARRIWLIFRLFVVWGRDGDRVAGKSLGRELKNKGQQPQRVDVLCFISRRSDMAAEDSVCAGRTLLKDDEWCGRNFI